jgi:hypothetical protein
VEKREPVDVSLHVRVVGEEMMSPLLRTKLLLRNHKLMTRVKEASVASNFIDSNDLMLIDTDEDYRYGQDENFFPSPFCSPGRQEAAVTLQNETGDEGMAAESNSDSRWGNEDLLEAEGEAIGMSDTMEVDRQDGIFEQSAIAEPVLAIVEPEESRAAVLISKAPLEQSPESLIGIGKIV